VAADLDAADTRPPVLRTATARRALKLDDRQLRGSCSKTAPVRAGDGRPYPQGRATAWPKPSLGVSFSPA